MKNLINSLCEHYNIQTQLAYYEADQHDEILAEGGVQTWQ
nr:MAG TPA: hypothetical protein [Caudoviricetes sp.]